ncbi:MAG: glycoside hydrolase family 3 C-terminal domain-containing protein, partial [Atopobiaceae bacterium]|nr:glycoside hydrolase family 3 C-terminal domain-containing protein [Atopobiaceae bacterium]
MAHADLIARMTLEQKCALLSGETAFTTYAFPELGVPSLQFSDGPHGMRVQGEGANHLGIGGSLPATCFPTAVTVANSWDCDLAEQIGEALAEESAAQKNNVVLGPGLCIKRDPLCGRNFEYFSEDPYLAGKMAAAYVRGIQSRGLSACPKHYAVNQQETRRQASDSVLDERTLREIYLTGFEIAVKEAAPKTIMTSYNLVNGTYANENEHLLKDILRDEWGFTGAVVTDWGGSNDHAAGVKAGSTFEMPGPALGSTRELMAAIAAGEISEADVDARCEEALELILSTDTARQSYPDRFDVDVHHELARKAAAAGIVLLKNDAASRQTASRGGQAEGNAARLSEGSASPLLPLAQGTKVALIGDFAKTPRYQGAGSSLVNSTKLETLLDCMQASDKLELIGYEQGFNRDGGPTDPAKVQAAKELSAKADVAVVCLGLGESHESEGAERMRMQLEENQLELLAEVSSANPHVVVHLFCGSSIETSWTRDAQAVLYCALGGQAGAAAAFDVLTGEVTPSGKLSETWPVAYADVPTAGRFPSEDFSSEYREGLFFGYRYFQTAHVPVAYPFGYGMSYTSFEYSKLTATPGQVSFSITNTGSVTGAEIAQLYVAKPDAQVFRPESELKGFVKIELAAGETKQVTIPLDDKAFRYFNVKTNKWEIEGGTYELRVGSSSEDIRCVATVAIAGTGALNPYEGLDVSCYETGQVKDVSDAQFAALLGHEIPSYSKTISRNSCVRDLGSSRSPLLMAVSKVVSGMVNSSYKKGAPNLNALFIHNMPLRAIAKNAGAVADMKLVDALVREAKGWGLAGIIPFLL